VKTASELEDLLINYNHVTPEYETTRLVRNPNWRQDFWNSPVRDNLRYLTDGNGNLLYEKYIEPEHSESGWSVWFEIFDDGMDDAKEYDLGDGVIVTPEAYEGSGEGQGEEIYMIFKVEEPDTLGRFFRKDGAYYSYDGCNWDGWFSEVTPQKVQVTEWRKV
jgi:hypothetical protein